MKFEELFREAKRLEAWLNTSLAEENAAEYDRFDAAINAEYDKGNLTVAQFNELALTAFYDYLDLKEEPEAYTCSEQKGAIDQ